MARPGWLKFCNKCFNSFFFFFQGPFPSLRNNWRRSKNISCVSKEFCQLSCELWKNCSWYFQNIPPYTQMFFRLIVMGRIKVQLLLLCYILSEMFQEFHLIFSLPHVFTCVFIIWSNGKKKELFCKHTCMLKCRDNLVCCWIRIITILWSRGIQETIWMQ